jgi:extradiol dioxygenase family protein
MIKPFHLSIVVADLEAVKDFYKDGLACKIGRDSGTWIDVLFFGHQLTIHQQSEGMKAQSIDHFGPVLDKDQWLLLIERLKLKSIQFVMQPTIRFEAKDSESGKFIIADPAHNLLEFKFYNSFSNTFEQD